MSILGLLAPDFALIALGFALRRWARFGDEFWPGLERVVYFVFFPALLFKALAQSHVEFASAGALLATAAAATVVGIVLASFARRFVHADPVSHASAFQCAFRFNSYLGFAIIGGLHGDAGIAAMALIQSLVIPLVNVVAVWALARHATYRNHPGHAEAVEIIFDPERIGYREILEFFFQIHDPTTRNRQGNDVGSSYRSAIFYTSDEQKRIAEDTIADVEASGLWPGKVVTEVVPASDFWEAEPEHQDYLVRNPGGYTCHFVRPKWKLPARKAKLRSEA